MNRSVRAFAFGLFRGVVVLTVVITLARADPAGLAPFEIAFPGSRVRILEDVFDDGDHTSDRGRIVVLQFKQPPDRGLLKEFSNPPVAIFERLNAVSFYARLQDNIDLETDLTVRRLIGKLRASYVPGVEDKISPSLRPGRPASPLLFGEQADERRAIVVFHRGTSASQAKGLFTDLSIQPIPYDPPRAWSISVTEAEREKLARSPIVKSLRVPSAPPTAFIEHAREVSGINALHGRIEPSIPPTFERLDAANQNVAVFDCPPSPREVDAGGESGIHTDLLAYRVSELVSAWSRVERRSEMDELACCVSPVVDSPDEICCKITDTGTVTGDDARCTTSEVLSFSVHGDQVMGIAAGNGSRTASQSNSGSVLPYDYRGAAPKIDVGVFNPTLTSTATHLKSSATKYAIANFSRATDWIIAGQASSAIDAAALAFPDENGAGGSEAHQRQVVVAAAGNMGARADPRLSSVQACDPTQGLCCASANGYYSVFAPSKNAIVVGVAHAEGLPVVESRASMSSMGPTADGRLKPDLMAPICHSYAPTEWGPRVLFTEDDGYEFSPNCGTSFAAPMVAGTVALLMQERSRVCDSEDSTGAESRCGTEASEDLLPSTYKAALVQGALDMQLPSDSCSGGSGVVALENGSPVYCAGPDYATGFGLLQAEASRDVITEFRVREHTLEFGATQGAETDTWTFTIPEEVVGDARSLRAVLAWDDPPYGDSLSGALVHDLDIRLVAPDGSSYGSWVPPPIDWNPCFVIASGDCPPNTETIADVALSGSFRRCCNLTTGFECPDGYDGADLLPNNGQPPSARRCVQRPAGWRESSSDAPLDQAAWHDLADAASGDLSEEDCRDARNNVERVDVDKPVAGIWSAEVTFRNAPSTGSTQSFSLTWGFEQPTTMETSYGSCRRIGLRATRFSEFGYVLSPYAGCAYERVDLFCSLFPESPFCSIVCQGADCPRRVVELRGWPRWARVALYTTDGRLVAEDHRPNKTTKRLTVQPRPDERYVLVISDDGARPSEKHLRRLPLTKAGARARWERWEEVLAPPRFTTPR